MSTTTGTCEQVRGLCQTRSSQDKLRLIEDLAQQLRGEMGASKKPFRSLRGALAHLGPAPSAEEIDEARREAWANFPRGDF